MASEATSPIRNPARDVFLRRAKTLRSCNAYLWVYLGHGSLQASGRFHTRFVHRIRFLLRFVSTEAYHKLWRFACEPALMPIRSDAVDAGAHHQDAADGRQR